MKFYVILLLLAAGNFQFSRAESLSEDDGFRRLLRRASAEADRPLIREQRRNKDEDDEDSFSEIIQQNPSHEDLERKRRAEEDKFYHTLLSRSEPKHLEKRSFDTNDVDNKAGYNIREDWTGDSKISDADRQELENLFQKLNSDDSPEKTDIVRSTSDDEPSNSVDGAAKDYTAWLMQQPANKLGAALSHKAEVDHKLTKLFFEDKDKKAPLSPAPTCTEKSHICKCKRTCHPYTVARYSPCRCSTNNPARASISKTHISDLSKHTHHAHKRGKKNDEDKPGNVKYPEPSHWKPTKKSDAPKNATLEKSNSTLENSNSLMENCSTAECLCERTCHPKPVASAAPCECQEKREGKVGNGTTSDTKHLIMQGSKLCTDDSPKCLCTRACYPRTIATIEPCNCEGENAPSNATAQKEEKKKENTSAQEVSNIVKPAAPAAKVGPMPMNIQMPQAQNTGTLDTHAQLPSTAVQAFNATSVVKPDQSAQLLNAAFNATAPIKAPYAPVLTPSTNASLLQTNTTTGAQRTMVDPVARSWCATACHPHGVAIENPCKCMPVTNAAAAQVAAPQPGVMHIAPVPVTASAALHGFPPRAPAVVPVLPPAAANFQSLAAVSAPVVPQAAYNYDPAASRQSVAYALPITDSSQETGHLDNACSRSCYPNYVINSNPCKCENRTSHPILPSVTSNLKPVDTKHPSYQGCYKDRMPLRDLPKRFTRYQTTPEACISECQYQNYKFAGVQYGYLCFCGNAFGRYGRVIDQDCNSRCNGDSKRNCGAFWHNSVYSVDGKEYDPSDFNFAEVDAAERLRDTLPAPPIKTIKKQSTPTKNDFRNRQGANVATHLMKAAQAALKAAQKLLPSVSKKHKVNTKGKNGKKQKREDDEEDAELMQEKMAAMASLGAARQIMQKTNFGMDKRDAEREKRSIDEDSDPYDPDNGKDLLTAYLSNVDVYKRQVRSVDDEEEEDDPNEKPKFEYRRMTLGETDEGEFVEKYEDEEADNKKKKRSAEEMDKRSISRSIGEKKKRSTLEGSGTEEKTKRSGPEGSGAGEKKNRSASEESGAREKKKRSVPESSGAGEQKKRSAPESSGAGEKKKRSTSEGSGAGEKKKQSVPEGRGAGEEKKRSAPEGSGAGEKKKRSAPAGSGAGQKKKRSIPEGSGAAEKKKRFAPEGSGAGGKKRRAALESSGTGEKKKRSLEGIGIGEKKKRSMEASGSGEKKKRSSFAMSGLGSRTRRSLPEEFKVNSRNRRSFMEGSAPTLRKRRSLTGASGQMQKKKRSTLVSSGAGQKKKRDLVFEELSDGAMKMAARSDDVNDIDASLRSVEFMARRDQIPEEGEIVANGSEEEEDDGSQGGENESGSGTATESEEETDEENADESGSESGDYEDRDMERRDIENDMENVFQKRSTDGPNTSNMTAATNASKTENGTENSHLRSDVEKGVDSLLNLVVELYKQQKTIKVFESSVRSLRHDILKELNVPSSKKNSATKKVRDEIQKTARQRLHVLTSSIEHKITEFARSHPEASKQAKLATSLLPRLPLSDEKYMESKKEITRRAAEFDNIEDAFEEQTEIPDILREHFRRNSEADDLETQSRREMINGEQTLSRMHRDVQEAEMETDESESDEGFEKLFN